MAVTVEPATPEDDAGLRRLLRDNPMDGEIRVSLEREPNAFLAAAVEGEPHHTIVARHPELGVVGMGSRAVWNAFVNGEPRRLGYLSQLRVDQAFRGKKRLLVEGYELLRTFRSPEELTFDLTSIIADNETARRLLGAGVRGLPAYREIEGWTTLILTASSRAKKMKGIERGSRERIPEIEAFLDEQRKRFQFAPRFSAADLLSPERSRGLAPEDFFLISDGNRLRGCLALWNQSSFKQVVVRGYAPRLARLRPWINLAAPLLGTPRLPEPGRNLPHAYVSHLAVEEPEVFQELIEAAYAEARARGYVYLVIGLASRHSALPWLRRRFRPREYASMLYGVDWEGSGEALAALDGRMPHVEVALL